jgi:peptidoglycan/xylan/chitin deacetylase (PgdA/CDA1 family)
MLAGLTVLLVLLTGQVVGAWQRRPVLDADTVSNDRRAPDPAAGRQELGARAPSSSSTAARGRATPPLRSRLAALGVRRVTGNTGVALTFDDGPDPVHTPRILAILRANGVRAMFCVVGSQVQRHPQLVAQMAREGHTLCNHSWRHEVELGTWPPDLIRENLIRTNAEIRRAAPRAKIPYFRHPGGAWTAAAVRVSRDLGMVPLHWSVDPRDWTKPTADTIAARVLAQAGPGSVVLLHDAGGDRSATVTACRSMIPALKREHRLVRLP